MVTPGSNPAKGRPVMKLNYDEEDFILFLAKWYAKGKSTVSSTQIRDGMKINDEQYKLIMESLHPFCADSVASRATEESFFYKIQVDGPLDSLGIWPEIKYKAHDIKVDRQDHTKAINRWVSRHPVFAYGIASVVVIAFAVGLFANILAILEYYSVKCTSP